MGGQLCFTHVWRVPLRSTYSEAKQIINGMMPLFVVAVVAAAIATPTSEMKCIQWFIAVASTDKTA